VRLETKNCGDCTLDLPLKQFATYRGKRHPLCRTCLAVDVAEFKAWVLPFVEARRKAVELPRSLEDWEIAVACRRELTGYQKVALTGRKVRAVNKYTIEAHRSERYHDKAVIRPWKYQLVGAE
jgi:hypothetical protein